MEGGNEGGSSGPKTPTRRGAIGAATVGVAAAVTSGLVAERTGFLGRLFNRYAKDTKKGPPAYEVKTVEGPIGGIDQDFLRRTFNYVGKDTDPAFWQKMDSTLKGNPPPDIDTVKKKEKTVNPGIMRDIRYSLTLPINGAGSPDRTVEMEISTRYPSPETAPRLASVTVIGTMVTPDGQFVGGYNEPIDHNYSIEQMMAVAERMFGKPNEWHQGEGSLRESMIAQTGNREGVTAFWVDTKGRLNVRIVETDLFPGIQESTSRQAPTE